MRKLATALAAFALLATSATPVMAAPCKDAKGKFIKCPPPKPAPVQKGPCKDAKGKFIKCAPKPAPAHKGPCKDAKGKFIKCPA